MASDIDQLLYPSRLSSLRMDLPPVQCKIWMGGQRYDTITLSDIYPFDTIDTLIRKISDHYEGDVTFHPKYIFVGVPLHNPYSEENPRLEEEYNAINYLWYPPGSKDPKDTYRLRHPVRTLTTGLATSEQMGVSPSRELRNRSTLEETFMKSDDGKMPIFHVYPLSTLLSEYKGVLPISEENWFKRFAPYFGFVPYGGPYRATEEETEFLQTIHSFMTRRQKTVDLLNEYIEGGVESATIRVSGIIQMLLTWKKSVPDFGGSATLFYELPVTEERPYMRLLPGTGGPITKLHVRGIVPIPTMDDPKLLESWEKDTNPKPGVDFCCIKYAHQHSTRTTPPIYGTIHVFNDGTMKLMLQPPKEVRKLYPTVDLHNMQQIAEEIFEGLPQPFTAFELKEMSMIFSMKTEMKAERFTKSRLQSRLPSFQTLFLEINPLPDNPSLISLRYKAVSQYASEDRINQFLTQISTKSSLQGEAPVQEWVLALQQEFEMSHQDATATVADWLKNRSTFTVQIPEDGEFSESYNPGVDIHIYAQHPNYYIHCYRIDSIETYRRIYTLLSLLFMEDNQYFRAQPSNTLSKAEEKLDRESMNDEVMYAADPFNNVLSVHSNMADPFAGEDFSAMDAADTRPMESETASAVFDDPFAEEDDEESPIVPIAAVAAPSVAKSALGKSEQQLVNPASWFILKLQQMDPQLFAYKTDEKDANAYSRKCAGHDDRQPSVLSKDQYDRMREIYEDDPIHWIIYPIQGKDDLIAPVNKEETITMMRYGSNDKSVRYYFCPEYYCLGDEIMIRPRDFEASVDREGNPKPPNTCPFCLGKLITERKRATLGYTVIKRKDKKAAKGPKYHQFIDFMSKTTHPNKLALPCCFLKQSTLRIGDPEFAHIRGALQEDEIGNLNLENAAEEEEEEVQSVYVRDGPSVPYDLLFQSIYRDYILDYNKHPDIQKFAAISPLFDTFFHQNSTHQMVERVAVQLKLRPNATGFLRVGTEQSPFESLLGVLVPILQYNTIAEVKYRIKEVVVPRIFLNSHFGNLVLEFYQPADGSAMPPTQQELRLWAQRELGITLSSTNLYPLIRVYNAYKRFIRFIDDPTKRKDLRHLQPLLAEPGLFTENGVQLMIMEDTDPIMMMCPIFGVSLDRHRNNDYVFVSRIMKTQEASRLKYPVYELYIYTLNRAARGGEPAYHDTIVRWDAASASDWPEIVKKRVEEFNEQCQSRYRSLYTSQQGVNPQAMIPLSKAVQAVEYRPDGIIKDQYNHIVGITFRSRPGSSYLVCLPVVDDGTITISAAFSIKNIYLDWDDIKVAPVEDVIQYYRAHLEPIFSLYPGYRIENVVRHEIEEKIIAVKLENGIYFPVAPPRDEAKLATFGIETISVRELEWEMNKRMEGMQSRNGMNNWDGLLDQMVDQKRCGSDPELINIPYEKLEEEYQQFRWMVSNWLSTDSTGEVRKEIERIIFHRDLPEYERRKRMWIYLSSTFLSWFYSDPQKWERSASFLRKDCRALQGPEQCSGSCHWKEDEGKCLLHVNEKSKMNGIEVNTAELFSRRVVDELVRFPARRKQLMEKGGVTKANPITQPIRIDDQYIIPEQSASWTELLRMEWMIPTIEKPIFYEEMSGPSDETSEKKEDTMPPEVRALFGENSSLELVLPEGGESSLQSVSGFLGIPLEQFGVAEDADTLTIDNLSMYALSSSKPIGMIHPGEESIEKQVQFVRPEIGDFDTVYLLVFLPNQIGIITEKEVSPAVRIESLPQAIQDRWKSAGIVRRRRWEPVVEQRLPTAALPLTVPRRAPPKMRREEPLVEKPVEILPVEEKKPFKRGPGPKRAKAIAAAASVAAAPNAAPPIRRPPPKMAKAMAALSQAKAVPRRGPPPKKDSASA